MNLIDQNIRLAAFDWLVIQSEIYPDGIPWSILQNEFIFHDEQITLIGAKGIWKPKQMELPISITTSHNGPYDDSKMEAGKLLIYKYRGDDPYHTDNVGLRNTIKNRTPLIYFISFRKGYYYAHWPVFIVNDNIPELNFYVDLTGTFITHNKEINDFESAVESSAPEKLYSTSQIKVRLYQKIFRENILMAYKCRCSLCKLRHRELLDAAHIIADKEEKGIPVIQNGISLCKIHHAAFDNNILGITPDYSIAVRKDVLKESDGPMLKFGIQELNDKKIILPANKEYWPDKDRLNDRFERFLKAG